MAAASTSSPWSDGSRARNTVSVGSLPAVARSFKFHKPVQAMPHHVETPLSGWNRISVRSAQHCKVRGFVSLPVIGA